MAYGNSAACWFLQKHHDFLPHTSVCRGACKLTPEIFCSTNTSSQDFHQLWRWIGWLQCSAWYILVLLITFLICFGNILFHSGFCMSEILRLLMLACFFKLSTSSGCISGQTFVSRPLPYFVAWAVGYSQFPLKGEITATAAAANSSQQSCRQKTAVSKMVWFTLYLQQKVYGKEWMCAHWGTKGLAGPPPCYVLPLLWKSNPVSSMRK